MKFVQQHLERAPIPNPSGGSENDICEHTGLLNAFLFSAPKYVTEHANYL